MPFNKRVYIYPDLTLGAVVGTEKQTYQQMLKNLWAYMKKHNLTKVEPIVVQA